MGNGKSDAIHASDSASGSASDSASDFVSDLHPNLHPILHPIFLSKKDCTRKNRMRQSAGKLASKSTGKFGLRLPGELIGRLVGRLEDLGAGR